MMWKVLMKVTLVAKSYEMTELGDLEVTGPCATKPLVIAWLHQDILLSNGNAQISNLKHLFLILQL